MKAVKVTFDNGDSISTDINGTNEEILAYYATGKTFNLGSVEDCMASVVSCEFIPNEVVIKTLSPMTDKEIELQLKLVSMVDGNEVAEWDERHYIDRDD